MRSSIFKRRVKLKGYFKNLIINATSINHEQRERIAPECFYMLLRRQDERRQKIREGRELNKTQESGTKMHFGIFVPSPVWCE